MEPPARPLPTGITPREVYLDRRRLLVLMGRLGAGLGTGLVSMLPASCSGRDEDDMLRPPIRRPGVFPAPRNDAFLLPNVVEKGLTPRRTAAVHNNFYEFLPGRGGPVWEHVGAFEVEPWSVEVTGECLKPRTFDLDDLYAFPHEERLYHFRCVERWAMNVPWTGFPLRLLLERVEPKSTARFVRFVSAAVPQQMPGLVATPHFPWPYHEALRMDEALHDLTLVATGVYGEALLKQHGAPVRIVVPWKYGYKGPKSVVRIELTREQPETFWSSAVPHEYGFLSNVNPNISHPRWKQTLSFWLSDDFIGPFTADRAFPTPLFNGYEAQVAALYPDEPRTPQLLVQPGQVAR